MLAALGTSARHPCTSAVCEITQSADGRFHAEVEFVSRKEWDVEWGRLREDLAAAVGDEASGEGDQKAIESVTRQALDKLRALFKAPREAGPEWFLQEDLKEPVAVTRALDAAKESFSYGAGEGGEFAEHLKVFLTSDQPFWPIVRLVRIRGPFPGLTGGIKLVDLPGINDPNEAREQVTRRYLKECKFVWLVFNAKRILTKDMVELMLSEEFFRQLIMDGRADRMAFISTHADNNINFEEACGQYNLDDDAPLTDILQARKRNLRGPVEVILSDMVGQLASRSGEDSSRIQTVRERLCRFKLFCVSARDFLLFVNKRGGRNKPALETPDQTELPALQAHLAELVRLYGREHHDQQIEDQLAALHREVERELQALRLRVKQRSEMNERQRQEVRAAATAARTFLDKKLKEFCQRYEQDLVARQETLMERFKHGKKRGRDGVENTLRAWRSMHFGTLSAVCRNSGRFSGTTGIHDLPENLAGPLLDSIAFTWDEFFGERLNAVMGEWYSKLLNLARQQTQEFLAAVYRQLGSGSRLRFDLEELTKTTEKVLLEQLAQSRAELQERIDTTRATLYERIPERVRVHMRPAFVKAGAETGKGMRDWIVDIHLRPAAFEVARVVFQEAENEIEAELRALQATLVRSYAERTNTVRRHADTNANNVCRDAEELSSEGLGQGEACLQDASRSLAALMEG
jgi:hypothetical protein